MRRLIFLGRHALRARLLRVLFFGGIGFILQTLIFELLAIQLNIAPPSTATLLGGEAGVLCSFFLNNRFSFQDRLHAYSSFSTRILKFHVVASGSLFIQWLFLFATEHTTDNLLIIHLAYGAGVVVGFISNYAGYHFFVWKKPAKVAVV